MFAAMKEFEGDKLMSILQSIVPERIVGIGEINKCLMGWFFLAEETKECFSPLLPLHF